MKTIIDFLRSDTFGFLLRLLSSLAAVVFGIVGLGTKTRNKKGTLTSSGRIALWGIIIAAILSSGTSVYDFTTRQIAAAAEKERTQRLMLSVQRGIYPMRGMKVSFGIALDREMVRAYQESLLPQMDCSIPGKMTPDYECQPFDDVIPRSSRLFPSPQKNPYFYRQGLTVILFKKVDQPRRYESVGHFLVYSFGDAISDETSIGHNRASNRLIAEFHDIVMTDKFAGENLVSGPYSLPDFMPGMIAVVPTQISAGKLGIMTLPDGVDAAPAWVQFVLPYPKQIEFGLHTGIVCKTKDFTALVLPIGSDVESAHIFTGPDLSKRTQEEISEACDAFKGEAFEHGVPYPVHEQ